MTKSSAFQKNTLDKATSPYLLQHKDNPVHWAEWSEETLELAKKEGRPLLVSIGYAACHWCHVMAHESFENPDIAEIMNSHFVNIKIDREERPDLDHIYQTALAMMGQQGGWPLTMFCTPEGKPFWGGTYFPPKQMMGRPGFPEVLESVSRSYRDQPDAVRNNVKALEEALTDFSRPKSGDPNFMTDSLLDDIGDQMLTYIDPDHGGLRGAPKFPNPTLLDFLWRSYTRRGEIPFKHSVIQSLKHMGNGGIYDHIGGGFARYSVDEKWHVPHFEKMLYDNALLISLMTEVWRDCQDPFFERKVRQTVEWALREMRVRAKGKKELQAFGSSLDADSLDPGGEMKEGAYYTWTAEEIEAHLDSDTAKLFKEFFQVTKDGNWPEGGAGISILNRQWSGEEEEDKDLEQTIQAACDTLLQKREGRARPFYDDKMLADLNGMMIDALASAARIFEEPEWLAAARESFDFVVRMAGRDEKGRLYHSWRDGKVRYNAMADDYVWMMTAALRLYECTGEGHYLDHARGWGAILEEDFKDPEHGGYFQTPPENTDIMVRPRIIQDNATPSSNGKLVETLARMAAHDPEGPWAERCDSLIAAFAGEIEGNIYGLFSYFSGIETFARRAHLEITGAQSDQTAKDLRDIVRHKSFPGLCWVDFPDKKEAQAVYCDISGCRPPLKSAGDLRAELESKAHE